MKITLIITLLFLITNSSHAQSIVGLWEIKQVNVGNQNMTPVAKWTRINEDNTFQNGNGWLQNAEGTWTYDESSQSFKPVQKNGLKDQFGPFTVSFSEHGMTWSREEEGMIVTVSLVPASEIPMGPADRLTGLWEPVDAGRDDRKYVFIRWDRIYLEGLADGSRKTGYWHINGHRPEITLLPHTGGNPESWRIDVTDLELTLTGISDSNRDQVQRFTRIDQFPD